MKATNQAKARAKAKFQPQPPTEQPVDCSQYESDARPALDCAAPLTTDSIAELLPSVPTGLNISQAIPDFDLESFDKQELLSRIASEHGLIERIERKELELAFAKLNCARNAGLLLQEFKRRCNYGEFLSSLESARIRPRTAQDYMAISKYWNLIEAKTRSSAFLKDCETLSINWALAAVRDEKKSLKKPLKSAAAASNPDSGRTSSAPERPILDLAIEPPPVETVQLVEGDLVQISNSNAQSGGNTGTVRGFANGGRSVIVRLDGGSVPSEIFNLSDLVPLPSHKVVAPTAPATIASVKQEQNAMAASLGLSNGKTVLPDCGKSDRARMERADPFTVDDRPFATAIEIEGNGESARWYEETAIGVISSTSGFDTSQAARMVSELLKVDFNRRTKAALENLSSSQLKQLLQLCEAELDNCQQRAIALADC
ncbi:MAG: hypothetical protein MUE44_28875 [Oscillatoriaceae cyanobacterium Prado104]|jgi:hypothetical protein|nr:hypothetical protein [Oscillatoriaceae cyanobacterium Prado104]